MVSHLVLMAHTVLADTFSTCHRVRMTVTLWNILFWSSCMSAVAAIQKITATQGDEVLIPCRSQFSTSWNADWWFKSTCTGHFCEPVLLVSVGVVVNGNVVRFSLINDSASTTSLRIATVRVTDTGMFTCIPNGGQSKERIESQLSVFDAGVNAPINTFMVFSGDTVVLPCHVDIAEPAADWWFQRKPRDAPEHICSAGYIVNGYAGRFMLDRSKPFDQNLVIHSIQANESGLYTCIAEAGIGKRTAIRVKILVGTDVVRIQPQTTSVGSTAQLRCNVTSSSVVNWWFESSMRPAMSEVSQLSHIFNSFTGKAVLIRNTSIGQYDLVVRNVAANDSGLYTCIEDFAGDGTGRRTRISLAVKAAPVEEQPTPSVTADNVSSEVFKYIMPILLVILVVAVMIVIPIVGMMQFRYQRKRTDDTELLRLADRVNVQLRELENRQSETENMGSFPPELESRWPQKKPDIIGLQQQQQ